MDWRVAFLSKVRFGSKVGQIRNRMCNALQISLELRVPVFMRFLHEPHKKLTLNGEVMSLLSIRPFILVVSEANEIML